MDPEKTDLLTLRRQPGLQGKSAPVIEDVRVVLDGDSRRQKIADCTHDFSRLEISRGVVVSANHTKARMVASNENHKLVQEFEIVVVVR